MDSAGGTDMGDVHYVELDIGTDTFGTIREADGAVTVSTNPSQNRIAITKTRDGNLLMCWSTQTEIECVRSSDGFNTVKDDRDDVYEDGTKEDWVLLFPANTADTSDACALFWDRSANVISVKMYDDSDGASGKWTEFTTTTISAADDAIDINMDGSVRHSDGLILCCCHSDDDTTTDDVLTFTVTPDDITTPTVTTKTDVITNIAESADCSMFINQQNDHVYVTYLKGGTWTTTADVFYKKSEDGMDTWGDEVAYSETASVNSQRSAAGRTVGDNGGFYQPSYFDNANDLVLINLVNDVAIAAVSGVTNTDRTPTIGAGALSGVAGVMDLGIPVPVEV